MTHSASCEDAEHPGCICSCGNTGHRLRAVLSAVGIGGDEPLLRYRNLLAGVNKQDLVTRRKAEERQAMLEQVVSLILLYVHDSEAPAGKLAARIAPVLSRDLVDDVIVALADAVPQRGHRLGAQHVWCSVLAALSKYFLVNEVLLPATVDDLYTYLESDLADQSIRRPSRRRGQRINAELVSGILPVVVPRIWDELQSHSSGEGVAGAIVAVRLLGSACCPDPDVHQDVVVSCIWPLVRQIRGPHAADLREWVSDQYL